MCVRSTQLVYFGGLGIVGIGTFMGGRGIGAVGSLAWPHRVRGGVGWMGSVDIMSGGLGGLRLIVQLASSNGSRAVQILVSIRWCCPRAAWLLWHQVACGWDWISGVAIVLALHGGIGMPSGDVIDVALGCLGP